jgi:hypothetical protein
MSDYDVIVEMLKRQQIDYETAAFDNGEKELEIEGGYAGFYTILRFDANGSLTSVGAYE